MHNAIFSTINVTFFVCNLLEFFLNVCLTLITFNFNTNYLILELMYDI